ncbi:hypothetical protein, partial [Micromonospora sp. MH33]|uniref:hypothetical protein n=1 Tax=Micromonospora sp. MH33 TaxID=1945509 RepID=UPI001AEFB6DA
DSPLLAPTLDHLGPLPPSITAAPPRDHGRAVAYHDVLTLPPETNKDNPPGPPFKSSSRSTPPAYPVVLILSAVQQFVNLMLIGFVS